MLAVSGAVQVRRQGRLGSGAVGRRWDERMNMENVAVGAAAPVLNSDASAAALVKHFRSFTKVFIIIY